MDLFTFNPPNRHIEIDQAPHELGRLSIKKMALIQREFGSFERFQSLINKASETIYSDDFAACVTWLIYELLVDKEYFQSLCDFRKKFLNQKQDIYERNIKELFGAIEDSQPVTNFKDLPQNKPTKKETKSKGVDYFSRSYVAISRELGYTIDQFYDLTFRQINQIQSDLTPLKNDDLEFQAAIHGAKINKPADNRPNSEINFTQEENKELMEFAKRRQEQLRNERSKLWT